MCAVLLQKLAYGGKLLAGLPLLIEGLVPFKGLLGVERQHLNFGLPLDHIQQRIDSGANAGVRQDADVGGLDDEEYQVAHAGGDTVVFDAVDPHELPGRLGRLIFFLSAHNVIPPSAKSAGNRPVQRMMTQQVTVLGC